MKPAIPRSRTHLLIHEYWLDWAAATNAGMPQVVRINTAMNVFGDKLVADFERRFPPTPRRCRTPATPQEL